MSTDTDPDPATETETETDRTGADSTSEPADPERRVETADGTERAVWEALRTVEDPELPVSIVDLGLIYDLSVERGRVEIDLTLTYSGCPARDLIVGDAELAVGAVDGIDGVEVTIVYSPPWSYDRITERGRRDLNAHGLAVPGDADAPDPTCYD